MQNKQYTNKQYTNKQYTNKQHKTSQPIGIILAGGLSSRMGTDKAELQRNGVTMLEHCQTLLGDVAIEQILISRNNGNGIADIIEKSGPLGGIYSVIKPLQDGDVLILPIDMPLLQASDLRQLIETGQQSNQPVCFEDCYLPLYLPVNALVKTYLQEQLYHDGNRSVKAFIKYFSGLQIQAANSIALVNTNTPLEWQQTLA